PVGVRGPRRHEPRRADAALRPGRARARVRGGRRRRAPRHAAAAPGTDAVIPRRLVVLGASNLTRGFPALLRVARGAWGDGLEVFGALGHGRSYGKRSHVLFRGLPGILESGLWPQLEAQPRLPGRALLTDVGNDILYHVPVDTILAWVAECVARL